jgi:hypothetical protein
VSLSIFALALVQLVVSCAVGWTTGGWLLRRTFAAGEPALPKWIGLPERALAAIVGFVVFSIALMVGHLITGGAVFGSQFVVPVVGGIVLAWGIRGVEWSLTVPRIKVSLCVLLLGAIFILPVLRAGTGVRTGDSPWHLGWSQQLLSGEPVPTGPVPELGRNAYPWGFHAVIATLVRLVPGSDPLIAHEALHFLLVFTIPLAAACLARALRPHAGWAGALAAGLIGGFGWMAAGGPDFILSPSLARYGADLVVASPNSVYELFPPALPRELGLVLLGAAGVMMIGAATHADRTRKAVAGGLVGVAGLVSVPIFVVGLAWIAAVSIGGKRGSRVRNALTMLVPAALVFGLWLGPVAVDYVRLGGFVNITPELGVEWPLYESLWSWGLLFPLAAAGVVLVLRRKSTAARRALLLAAVTVALLAVALVRSEFGWGLAGNATLLHQGRIWPVVHLLGAAFAGVALARLYELLRRRRRGAATLVVAGLLAVGAASPALASIHLTEVIEAYDAGYLYRRPDFDDDAFVPRAAAELGPRDVVKVEGSNFLGFLLFSLSGVRLATYDDARLTHNDLRLRYAQLAEEWDRRIAAGGFEPDYVVMRRSDAPAGAEPVVSGPFRDEMWVMIDARHAAQAVLEP